MRGTYDLAIVGSGFGGALTAMIARRLGLSVLLLERGTHPRFAIGESTSPLTNLLLEQLAQRYDLPRLVPFTEYGKWHLGIDDSEPDDTKERYKFPYGDFELVHRCGLLAAESRAGQYKHTSIEAAAGAEMETCHRLRGILSKLLEAKAKRRVRLAEVECVSTGARECVFEREGGS